MFCADEQGMEGREERQMRPRLAGGLNEWIPGTARSPGRLGDGPSR